MARSRAVSWTIGIVRQGVVFFAFVLDAYSRRIVAWRFAGHMRTDLVLDAMRMALAPRRGTVDLSLS